MKIVSKQKDYYDLGMQYGHSDSVVYIREEKDLPFKLPHSYGLSRWNEIAIGFCGKVYPLLFAQYSIRDTITSKEEYCYTQAEVETFIKSYFTQKESDEYYGVRKNKYDSWRRAYCTEKKHQHFFNESFYQAYYAKYFTECNTPIFVIDFHRNIAKANVLLRPYEFFKVFDSWAAYQEIQMYVGGVLQGPTNPIPEIPNDIMIEAKGFDPKRSFRKEPE